MTHIQMLLSRLFYHKQGKYTINDLTFAFNRSNKWLQAHQMTVHGKRTHMNEDDLIAAGLTMGLKKRTCKEIIAEISDVIGHFHDFAQKAGIREEICDKIISLQQQEGLE